MTNINDLVTTSASLFITVITPQHTQQIKEEDIDHMRVFKMHECTNEFLRRAYKEVSEMEKMKKYPPRLILKVLRKNCAQWDLRADVLVKGIEPELLISIYAPLPGQLIIIMFIILTDVYRQSFIR